MNQIISVEQDEFDRLTLLGNEAFDDNFVLSAHLQGIQNYERILNILADPETESIEFRRQRILSRLAGIGPFTKFYLIKFLNAAVGAGNYRLAINVYEEYNVMLRLSDDKLALEAEIKSYLRQMIPANMTLDLAQMWANWQDVLTRYLTWEKVLDADKWSDVMAAATWGKYKDNTWEEISHKVWERLLDPETWGEKRDIWWKDIMNANDWAYIKNYNWED